MSMEIRLNRDELRDKIYGCWLGKNIGGTLGAPYEGKRELLDIKGYQNPTGEPLPNDDLDLQLVWLKAVKESGPNGINNRVLGEYWLDYIPIYPNEYGICKANLAAGLLPPVSGMYRNPWKDSNGGWIRTEIWACLAPGCPDIAVRFAYEDASVDHGVSEGLYAAMFTAALQSAAFVLSDRDALLEIGLSKIPPDCRVAKCIRVAVKGHADRLTWQQARKNVLTEIADMGWFMAPANVAFAVIGWLYGEGDFGRSLCIAVNCGDDTDCSAATLGALLGIILGGNNIPSEWVEPIGDRIVTSSINAPFVSPPKTLAELTDQVMDEVDGFVHAFGGQIRIIDGETDLSSVQSINLNDDKTAREIWERSPYASTWDFVHSTVMLDYCREPEVKAGEPFTLKIGVGVTDKYRYLEFIWHLPEEWRVMPGKQMRVLGAGYGPAFATTLTVDIIADEICEPVTRGILEVRAQGRPNIGYIPLVFLNGDQEYEHTYSTEFLGPIKPEEITT